MGKYVNGFVKAMYLLVWQVVDKPTNLVLVVVLFIPNLYSYFILQNVLV